MMGYLLEERETHLHYDATDKVWKAWTNIPYVAEKLRKCGWKQVSVGKDGGEEVDWSFTGESNAITFRDMTKPKRERTDAQKRATERLIASKDKLHADDAKTVSPTEYSEEKTAK